VVDSVIDALTANATISSVTSTNTRVVVAAGGFEGGTNPSFVLTVKDSGAGSVTEADVDVLGNALGYVLNQGSTVHFSPDNFKAYVFPLDYILVTFSGLLSGDEAQAFFEHLGTIDEALFSGLFAGFTQVDLPGSLTNNSMLFLQPAVTENHDPELFTPGKCPHAIIVDFLHVPELISGKVILNIRKKRNFLSDAGNFIFPGFCCCLMAAILGNFRMVLSVFIEAGNLAPVCFSPLIRFFMKHVGVDATDGKTPVVNPAPVVLQEVAGPAIIVLCPQGIPGYIECLVLVAKLRVRSRFN
jgi:hypothetical protein